MVAPSMAPVPPKTQQQPIQPIYPPIALIAPLQDAQFVHMETVEYIIPPSSAGNTYAFGNCTHYAKQRRPDLPNNLGHAKYWASQAAAQGIATGSTPQVGAIGVTTGGYYGHVVYIESVSGDYMTISEKNFEGFNVVSSRTIPWSGWSFIY